jgi:hypothetical protein
MSKSCPYCGTIVEDHLGKCPKCGLDFANRPAQPTNVTQTSPGGFPTAPDPFSSPGIWNPSKGQPVLQPVRTGNVGRTIAIIAAVVLVLGIAGAVFFYVTREVADNFDFDEPARPPVIRTAPNGNGGDKGPSKQERLEVKGSRALFRLMNENGAKCTGYNQVIDSATVDAASCFAGTEAWTIQVFFDDLSYDAVVANYTASDTIDVAYGGNWTVLVQTEKSARKIARATGGDWS